ncbi:MAG: electron transport complex subunit E [Clostridia bacterium]|nr:electron transport complex subunit E [Clostridia bacterium]
MKRALERLYNGIIKENPVFVLLLGMCATLAVTTSAINGLGMGLSTMTVLVLSNLMISLLRKVIPTGVRMPAYIVIIATFVTMVQFLLQAYVPSLYDALGIFIPLIVVNCIILGRAEAYASKQTVFLSVFDGLGMGLGFTLALTIIGLTRELFGSGSVFGIMVMPKAYEPISILVMAPGAFLVLAVLAAVQNKLKAPRKGGEQADSNPSCGGHCAGCTGCGAAQDKTGGID